MITERGRVVAVEVDSLWVETVRQSTCGSCIAQKGCGHGLLNSIGSGRRSHVRALLGELNPGDFAVDDEVEISIPEQVLLTGALLVYLLPLLCLLAGAVLAGSRGEGAAVAGALVGFVGGLGLVRWHAHISRNNPSMQPRVVPRAARPPVVTLQP